MIFKDNSGKWSHKRIISLCLIIVSIVMGFMEYPMEYVYFFGIVGLVNIGMTVWNSMSRKIADIPPEDKDQKPPG